MSNPTWDLYQSLHAVLQSGSLSAASRSRGLTQPTIGRHIEALEQQLGAPLFLRSPRGLTPTDLAVSLKAHLEEMHAAAAAAARDASGSADSEKGSIRIAASLIVGVEVLPQILSGFMEKHPEIAIELVLSNKIEDLSRRDADIAVRMARPTQGALVARKVGMLGVGFYATQAYLDRRGVPASLEDLENHTIIGFDRERPPLEALAGIDFPRPITRDIFNFRTDDDAAQVSAIRAGMGIGGVQHQIARRDGLTPVLANAFSFQMECWIAMHENLKGSRRMRLMFDHLAAGFAEYLGRSK